MSVFDEEFLFSADIALKRIRHAQRHTLRCDAFFNAAGKYFRILTDEVLFIYEYLLVEFVLELLLGERSPGESRLGEAAAPDRYGKLFPEEHSRRLRGLRLKAGEFVFAYIQRNIEAEQPQRTLGPFSARGHGADRCE